MNINTILTIGLAIAAGAAIYFIFQEIQQEKRKVEALSQHMRRLESLVWTYNIRPQPANNGGEYATDTDVSDEEGMIQASSPYPQAADSYEEEIDEEGEAEVEAIPTGGIPLSFSMFSFSNAAPQQQQQPEAPPQIEVVEEEHDDHNAAIPEVVSFDTTQRASVQHSSSDATIAIEDEQDPPSPTHSDGEVAVSETVAVVEKSDGEEVGEPKTEATTTATPGRVYADTAKNRRMGRVGLPY